MGTPERDERGTAALEFAITMPLLLLALMLVVQFGLVAHAQNAAQMAADEGAAEARAFRGSSGAGKATATNMVGQLAGQTLNGVTISARRSATEATVTVSGTVLGLVPGFTRAFKVTRTSTGPVERFVPPAGGAP